MCEEIIRKTNSANRGVAEQSDVDAEREVRRVFHVRPLDLHAFAPFQGQHRIAGIEPAHGQDCNLCQ